MILPLLVLAATMVTQPDHSLTPGATNKMLTQRRLCAPAFRAASVRHVSLSEKRAVCAAYRIAGHCPGPGWEIDHLVPLELGGSNAIENLWPQPADRSGVIGYHRKDVVENKAKAAVCSGRLALDDAQKGIALDWYTFGISNGFIQPLH